MRAAGALRRLVGDERRFAEEHWGRRPLLRTGAGEFADLLDLPDVDQLVTDTLLRLPGIRLVKDGTPLPPARYTRTLRIGSRRVGETVRPERVLEAFADGATIALQALHRQWPPVARFCRDLELDLTHPVQANAYVTPATSQGFSIHHDTHDVFVVQTRGRKSWRVFEPIVELAGAEQRWTKDLGNPGEPTIEVELEPGDVLYIPRGFPHEAAAREEVSIHLTIGVNAKTWLDVWRHVMEEAPEHLPFREPLAIGFARDPEGLSGEMTSRAAELQAWLDKSVGEEVARGFVRAFWSRRRPLLRGGLEQVAELGSLDDSSRLRPRVGTVFGISREGDEVAMLVPGRELRMPAFCEPAVRALMGSDSVAVGELPGLDGASRLVLARRLIREGVVEVVDAGA